MELMLARQNTNIFANLEVFCANGALLAACLLPGTFGR
jgi:hypothetical protein